MSFADELRSAPEERKRDEERWRQRELEQQKSDWSAVIDTWYEFIKDACKSAARYDETSCTVHLYSAFNELYGEDFDDSNEGCLEKLPEWLRRVTPRIRRRPYPREDCRSEICLSKDDVEQVESIVRQRLELEGLSVVFKRKDYKIHKVERVFVKRSNGERAFASILNTVLPSNTAGLSDNEGYYRNRTVMDEVRYGLSATVSW